MNKRNRNLFLAIVLVNSLLTATFFLNGVASWLDIILGGLWLIAVAGFGVYHYIWFRWTRPVDSETTLSSEGESSQL